jgi:hypothetical protein
MSQKIEAAGSRLHMQKRTRTTVLGAAILAIAAICLCILLFFIIKSAAGYVKDFLGPDETPDYFDSYLEPAVMFDPEVFDNISNAEPDWELETAIWASLDDGEQSGRYALAEDGREILPVKDVTGNLKKYFGDAVHPTFQTFSDGDFTYEFDKKNQCYYIPLIAVTDFYLPHVTKISRNFKTVTLTVQYIPGQNWGQDGNGTALQQTPDKTMVFVLKGSRGGYQITGLKEDNNVQDASSVRNEIIQNSSSSSKN